MFYYSNMKMLELIMKKVILKVIIIYRIKNYLKLYVF